ncbi:MAG: transporter substrate-binding domain-containing protein [Chloroflexota bacterium]
MKPFMLVVSIMMVLVCAVYSTPATAQGTVPTLVPPTPVPVPPSAPFDALLAQSALARIQESGTVRVGMLYNEPPFGELNIRGEVDGFDATLGRKLAETWGVEVEFSQVTRQTAIDVLLNDDIDLLIAAQVHRRELSGTVEFSQPYYQGSQAMMVRLDDGAENLNGLANRRVGVVTGTDSENALTFWQQRSGTALTVQRYLTMDGALVALVNNEIDGVVGKRYQLRERVDPDRTRVLDETVQPEPYTIAMRRQDVNLRNLVNRTLQYLVSNGDMADIHNAFFPSAPYPEDTIKLWENIGEEAPQLAQFSTDVPYPQQYALPRVQSSGVVRVAGVFNPPPETPEGERRLAEAAANVAGQMGLRWDVNVEFINTTDPVGAVERGEADIAFGVRPDWNAANRVDFTGMYLLRGKRLLVETQFEYNSFSELRGKWVGVFASEPGADDEVRDLAEQVNVVSLNIFSITRDEDAAYEMIVEDNIDVIYGDSIRLLPHLEANPGQVKLSERCAACDPWYTREYLALAVPRNDLDFHLLVDYTLQEMWLDGTLEAALQRVTVPGESLTYDVYPGSSDYLGFSLAQS